MGISKKKSKTVTDTHSVSTPINPTQVTNGLTGFADTVSGLQGRDPASFTVGADPLQTQAASSAGGLGGAMPGALASLTNSTNGALDLTRSIAGASAPQMAASRANGFIGDYMNPYTNDVVNSSLADYDFGAGQSRAAQRLSYGALDDTFGGSGRYIADPALEDAINRGRGSLSSGLRSQGFTQALGAAQSDADRQQQASQVNAGLLDSNLSRQLAAAGQQGALANSLFASNLAGDANSRANIDAQAAQGDNMRQIALQKQLAPLTVASAIGGLWGSAPFGLLHGQDDLMHSTSKTTVSDPMGTIGGLMAGAGSLATGLGGLGLKLPGAK